MCATEDVVEDYIDDFLIANLTSPLGVCPAVDFR